MRGAQKLNNRPDTKVIAMSSIDNAFSKASLGAATVLYHPDPVLLRAMLVTLEEEGYPLFVFANGPLSAEVDSVLASLAHVRIFQSPTNVGLGAGLNALVAAVEAEGFSHVLLFDQDSTPQSGQAAALLARFAACEKAIGQRLAALGPRLVPPARSTFLPIRYWRRERRNNAQMSTVDFLPTSGSLVLVDAWRQVGPFRADYFIAGIDVEWGFRAWHCGWALALVEDVELVHRWGTEQRSARQQAQILRESASRFYYHVRNVVNGLGLGHMPWRWKCHQTLRLAGQVALVFVRRRDVPMRLILRAISDGWSGRMGPIPAGLA